MLTDISKVKFSYSAVIVSMLAILSACTMSPRVFVDSDPDHSFASYQNFSWIGEKAMLVSGDTGPNALVAARFKTEVKTAFENNGYTFVANPAEADFVVSFTVGARNGIDIREYDIEEYFRSSRGGTWHRDRFGYVVPGKRRTTVSEAREYTEGTLAIDVFDVAERKPVWHAGANKRLSSRELRDSSVESIREAVTQVLLSFPTKTTLNES